MVFPYKYKYYFLSYTNNPDAKHMKMAEYNSPRALIHYNVAYYYRAKVAIGNGHKGMLILPKILIDSKPYDGPVVQFEWRERLGVGSFGA